MPDYQRAYVALREAVLRIRDGDHPGRSVREALDDAIGEGDRALVPPAPHGGSFA